MFSTSIPASASQYGFVTHGLGAHSSRTMQLAELRLLFDACPPAAASEDYRTAVLHDNVLLKQTETTRRKTLRYLVQLYTLNPCVLIFRALRDLWYEDTTAQPVLTLLCAIARDPCLQASAAGILDALPNAPVTGAYLADKVAAQWPGRLNATTLATIGRNTASSWTQAGHLSGLVKKVRNTAQIRPTSTVYALLLAYLCGARGDALFHSPWTQLLDAPLQMLHEQTFLAAQRGWLEYRHAGAVTEIGFSHLLRAETSAHE
jgi:hypothetical protein